MRIEEQEDINVELLFDPEESEKTNQKYLDIFRQSLIDKNLKPKTIKRHVANADLYINDYLAFNQQTAMEKGTILISDFLGYFFIRKCMWSSPASIKTTAASIKKFYKCMCINGFVDAYDYLDLCETIKENMEYWQYTCKVFDDPDQQNPFELY